MERTISAAVGAQTRRTISAQIIRACTACGRNPGAPGLSTCPHCGTALPASEPLGKLNAETFLERVALTLRRWRNNINARRLARLRRSGQGIAP